VFRLLWGVRVNVCTSVEVRYFPMNNEVNKKTISPSCSLYSIDCILPCFSLYLSNTALFILQSKLNPTFSNPSCRPTPHRQCDMGRAAHPPNWTELRSRIFTSSLSQASAKSQRSLTCLGEASMVRAEDETAGLQKRTWLVRTEEGRKKGTGTHISRGVNYSFFLLLVC
jgi:hypothetical protein